MIDETVGLAAERHASERLPPRLQFACRSPLAHRRGQDRADGFQALLNHLAFRDVPKIMETPKETEEDDPRNMKTVKIL
jgi:hypothetical protein